MLEKLSQPVCKSLYIQRHYETPKEQKEEKDFFAPKFEQAKTEGKKIRILSNIKLNDFIKIPSRNEEVSGSVIEEESAEYEVESVKSSEDSCEPTLSSVEIVEIEEEFELIAKTESRISDDLEEQEEVIDLELEDEKETIVFEKSISEIVNKRGSPERIFLQNLENKVPKGDVTEEEVEESKRGKNVVGNGGGKDGPEMNAGEHAENFGGRVENGDLENVEPPRKKIREAENVDEEDMMDSFVDVINE